MRACANTHAYTRTPALWRNVRVRDTKPHPWYDTDIDVARNKERKQENVWSRTKLEIHRQLYVTARDECTALISARKTDLFIYYFRNQLEKESNKNMFRLLRSLNGQRVQQQPEFCSVSTTSIGHQTKDVSLTIILMCLIEQRTQRSQRFVVLLRKRACWILCLQISSVITSPVLCLPSHGSQMLPWTRE